MTLDLLSCLQAVLPHLEKMVKCLAKVKVTDDTEESILSFRVKMYVLLFECLADAERWTDGLEATAKSLKVHFLCDAQPIQSLAYSLAFLPRCLSFFVLHAPHPPNVDPQVLLPAFAPQPGTLLRPLAWLTKDTEVITKSLIFTLQKC